MSGICLKVSDGGREPEELLWNKDTMGTVEVKSGVVFVQVSSGPGFD